MTEKMLQVCKKRSSDQMMTYFIKLNMTDRSTVIVNRGSANLLLKTLTLYKIGSLKWGSK